MTDTPSELAPRFASLAKLGPLDSDGRRALLRQVTEALSNPATATIDLAEFDTALAAAAGDFSKQVRCEIARLVAAHAGLGNTAATLAFNDIEVAAPILRRSRALSDEVLLKVIYEQSQEHLLAVTQRAHVSEKLSHALVERGDDRVVASLLDNAKAEISVLTYGRIADRAENSTMLQAPLVRRKSVPPELLTAVFLKAEASLKREILAKMDGISAQDMEAAFARSRARVTSHYGRPDDFREAQLRIDALAQTGTLRPATLVSLLREGASARTAFKIAFARLTGMEMDLIERVVEGHDIDTVALLCRGSGMDRAVFVTLAVATDTDPKRGLAGAPQFMALYDSVPPAAAERALRFWKIRTAA